MDFTVEENFRGLDRLPDSMCLDSGQTVCTFKDGEDEISIEVRGYVTVGYKGTIYSHFSEMPVELKEMFRDGTAYDCEEVVINENNWYEIFINRDEEYDVAEIEGMNVSDLEGYCKEWLEQYRQYRAECEKEVDDER